MSHSDWELGEAFDAIENALLELPKLRAAETELVSLRQQVQELEDARDAIEVRLVECIGERDALKQQLATAQADVAMLLEALMPKTINQFAEVNGAVESRRWEGKAYAKRVQAMEEALKEIVHKINAEGSEVSPTSLWRIARKALGKEQNIG